MVKAWLCNVIDPIVYRSVTYAGSARAIWVDLEERYSQGNSIRVHQLKREIVLSGQDVLSVTEYFQNSKHYGMNWEHTSFCQAVRVDVNVGQRRRLLGSLRKKNCINF